MDTKVFELVEKHVPPKRPNGHGMTVSEYAQRKGVSPHYARKILKELADAGILDRVPMISGKSVCDVYTEAKKKK